MGEASGANEMTGTGETSGAAAARVAAPGEHYFSPEPAAPLARRTIRVELAGRELEATTANGMFSPAELDRGTAVLLGESPEPPERGIALDLGCGWGPIALDLALRSPQLEIWAVDVNARARDCAAENLERIARGRARVVAPEDVPEDVRFDLIRSNPPIRVGKAELHAILERWLPRLAPGGTAQLVVAKHLGADSLERWLAERFAPEGIQTRRIATSKGFRVLEARR